MKKVKRFQSKNTSILNSSVTTYGKNKLRVISSDVNWFCVQNHKKGLFSDSDRDDSGANLSTKYGNILLLEDFNLQKQKKNNLFSSSDDSNFDLQTLSSSSSCHKETNRISKYQLQKRKRLLRKKSISSDSDDSDAVVQTSFLHPIGKKKTARTAKKKQTRQSRKKKKVARNSFKKYVTGSKLPKKAEKTSLKRKRLKKEPAGSDSCSTVMQRAHKRTDQYSGSSNEKTKTRLKEGSRCTIMPFVVDLSEDKISFKQENPSRISSKEFEALIRPCSVDLSRDKVTKLSDYSSKCKFSFKLSSPCTSSKATEIVCFSENQSNQSSMNRSDNGANLNPSSSMFKSHLCQSLRVLRSSKEKLITRRRKRVNFKLTDGTSMFSFRENCLEPSESMEIFQNSILCGNHDSLLNIGSMLLQSFEQHKASNPNKFLIQSTPMIKNRKTIFPGALSPLPTADDSSFNLNNPSLVPSMHLNITPSPKQKSSHRTSNNESSLDARKKTLSAPIAANDKENLSSLCVEKILHECEQTALITFGSLNYDEHSCVKLGEGVYGEVYKCCTVDCKNLAVKVIPVNGRLTVNNEKQKRFSEVLPEIVSSRELSSLNNCSSNCSDSFIYLHNVYCVSGEYPEFLLKAWDRFDEKQGSENQRPDFLPRSQHYIVFEYSNGGESVERFRFRNAAQALSVLRQTIAGLAVAEEVFNFEHRDLHWGNVLVEATRDKHVDVMLAGVTQKIETAGIRAKIIDFTFSRMTKGGLTLFQDLSTDPEIFLGDSAIDYQFKIYRMMQEENSNDWSLYKPITNVFWIHYLTYKFLNTIKYKSTQTKIHKNSFQKLKTFNGELLSYQSCADLLQNSVLFRR